MDHTHIRDIPKHGCDNVFRIGVDDNGWALHATFSSLYFGILWLYSVLIFS
ncbi:hypothetical protein D3C71_2110490 [compost metagenome]